jgi:hypothetical protein
MAFSATENGGFQKRSVEWRFSKTLSRVVVFQNADFVFTFGQAKTEVFKNDGAVIG